MVYVGLGRKRRKKMHGGIDKYVGLCHDFEQSRAEQSRAEQSL